MKLFCTCSIDTYITDKIIGDNRSENSNVGSAGTLDLFKLWGETLFRSTGSQNEVSRILVKFDLSKIKNKIKDRVDINSPSFSARLKLFDITAGNATPSNFNILASPLSQSFLEGSGRDVGSFSDIDTCNFLTASYANGGDIKWFMSGANAAGQLDSKNIDYITTADLDKPTGQNIVNIAATQYFKNGTEDLDIDITTIVSASLAGRIPDHGFRIAFSGSDDSDKKSRFVKRFASRNASNPNKRPRIEISYDDSIQDNHLNFIFNHTGSLFLENVVNYSYSNILSGSSLTPVTGPNCMNLKLEAGLFSYKTSVSQVVRGSDKIATIGVYSSSFALDTFNQSQYNRNLTLSNKISRDGYVDFRTYWESLDGSYAYHTGSLRIYKNKPHSGTRVSSLRMNATNLKLEYDHSEISKIRLFAVDDSIVQQHSKSSRQLSSVILQNSHYRLVDFNTGQTIFDFDEINNSTKISSDAKGLFFDFDFSVAPRGRSYAFEYLIIEGLDRKIIRDPNTRFLVS